MNALAAIFFVVAGLLYGLVVGASTKSVLKTRVISLSLQDVVDKFGADCSVLLTHQSLGRPLLDLSLREIEHIIDKTVLVQAGDKLIKGRLKKVLTDDGLMAIVRIGPKQALVEEKSGGFSFQDHGDGLFDYKCCKVNAVLVQAGTDPVPFSSSSDKDKPQAVIAKYRGGSIYELKRYDFESKRYETYKIRLAEVYGDEDTPTSWTLIFDRLVLQSYDEYFDVTVPVTSLIAIDEAAKR